MAWRLPTQLLTPGNLHHHLKTSANNGQPSWSRTLTPLPLPSCSLSCSTTSSTGKFCTQQQVVRCSVSGGGSVQAVNVGTRDTCEANKHTGGWCNGDTWQTDCEACT
ncbi:hypothetical protein Patl1_35695 [Pistacia atlantica]|nr:hypothetical protein Patl1_35695 [Pistacia atlantica]